MTEENNKQLPVYSCTLATLNELTRKRYESAGSEPISQIEVSVPFKDEDISLEKTINKCKQALLAKARKIDISAIVVEATYITSEHIMSPTLYATGIAVTDHTGQPRFC